MERTAILADKIKRFIMFLVIMKNCNLILIGAWSQLVYNGDDIYNLPY